MITYENWVKDRWRAICVITRYMNQRFQEKVKATPSIWKFMVWRIKASGFWWEGGVSAQEFLTLYNSYLIQVTWYMVDVKLKRREIKVMPAWEVDAIKWKTILWYIRNYLILMANKIWVQIYTFSVQLNLFSEWINSSAYRAKLRLPRGFRPL